MIKVLIVDDHKILRDGIVAIFDAFKDIKIIGQCEDGSEVLGFLKDKQADVILMDIMMPKINGFEATKLVKEKYPDIKILALTMHNDYNYIHEMLEAGANGFILKNTSSEEMHKAITAVFDNKSFFSAEVTDIVMQSHVKPTMKHSTPDSRELKQIKESLTEREMDVLKLIAEEYTNKEIGDELNISRRTVDTHRRNLIRKIGAKNSIGLIRYAYSVGLID